MSIRWSSLVATPEGEVEMAKLRSLASIGLAVLGGLILSGVMTGLLNAPTEVLLIGVGALVLPLTGGSIAHGLSKGLAGQAADPSPAPPSSDGTAG